MEPLKASMLPATLFLIHTSFPQFSDLHLECSSIHVEFLAFRTIGIRPEPLPALMTR